MEANDGIRALTAARHIALHVIRINGMDNNSRLAYARELSRVTNSATCQLLNELGDRAWKHHFEFDSQPLTAHECAVASLAFDFIEGSLPDKPTEDSSEVAQLAWRTFEWIPDAVRALITEGAVT